jgi:hypothetical protein
MSREKLQNSFLPSFSTFLGLILWLPMSQVEQSRCIRWFLVWLPSKLKVCPTYPNQQLTKKYANYCLGVHQYLQIPEPINDPPVLPLEYTTALKSCSFRNTISSFFRWSAVCNSFYERVRLSHHNKLPSQPPQLGQKLLNYLHDNLR